MISAPGDPPGLARDEGAQLGGVQALGELLDMGGLARSLTSSKVMNAENDRPRVTTDRAPDRHPVSSSRLSAPAPTLPMTSSLTRTIAPGIVDPCRSLRRVAESLIGNVGAAPKPCDDCRTRRRSGTPRGAVLSDSSPLREVRDRASPPISRSCRAPERRQACAPSSAEPGDRRR